MHSWRILLLPYLERQDLYEEYSFEEPWNGPNNRKLSNRMPAVFGFDGTVEPGVSWQTNFVAITGNETVWPPGTVMRDADVADDHSQTIRFSEYDGPSIHWMEPRDLELSTMTLVVNDKRGISQLGKSFRSVTICAGDCRSGRSGDSIQDHCSFAPQKLLESRRS